MGDTIRIVEMGARDGLQNEKTPVSVENRIAFIGKLFGAGLHTIEVGAFVSPKAIPQMVGSDEVLRGVNHLAGEFHVLVPNARGGASLRREGGFGVCRGIRRFLARQYQLLHRRVDRALQAGDGPRQG
jgi:hydroxymethylglutaryl-CoA lyase